MSGIHLLGRRLCTAVLACGVLLVGFDAHAQTDGTLVVHVTSRDGAVAQADVRSGKITAVTEITGMEQEVITMQDIFLFERTGLSPEGKVRGHFRATGIRPKCTERLGASGFHLPMDMFEHIKAVA